MRAIAIFLLMATLAARGTPVDKHYYLVGEARTAIGPNTEVESQVYIAHRWLKPAESVIRVDLAGVGKSGEGQRHVTLMRVSGTTFTMQSNELGYTGEGVLEGEPWNWHRWRYALRWSDGSRMEGEDRLDAHALTLEKRYYDPQGRLVRTIRAELARVTEAVHAILVARLFPPGR